MKKVLIVMHGLGCGGAEKSLISFLSSLENVDWEIDMIVMNPNGMLMKSIPDYVHVLNDLYDVENFLTPVRLRRKKVCGLRDLFNQIRWYIMDAPMRKKYPSFSERKWQLWGRHLPKLEKEYDLAVSYLHNAPNYYVIDKVNARKKILWIHNEFEKLGFSADYERRFYAAADKIVTISQSCVDSFLRVMPEFKDKICVLENISSSKVIGILAQEKIDDPFFKTKRMKFLSIGRLGEQKGFDYAIEVADKLKKDGVDFLWYILGEGTLRKTLQEGIESRGLKDNVILAGVKENPYPFLANCDIFVQPSRYEGKSIALDEAKICHCPIVVTNYKTVVDSIEDGKNGLIAEINTESIYETMKKLIDNADLRKSLSDNLRSTKQGNEDELDKYVDLFETLMREK